MYGYLCTVHKYIGHSELNSEYIQPMNICNCNLLEHYREGATIEVHFQEMIITQTHILQIFIQRHQKECIMIIEGVVWAEHIDLDWIVDSVDHMSMMIYTES